MTAIDETGPLAASANGAHPAPAESKTIAAEVALPVDRLGAVWKAKWWIILATVIVAAATFTITQIIPKTYESTSQVTLSAAPTSNGASADLVTAANDLAAQYAQLATSTPVVAAAASASGASTDDLRSKTSAGTVAGQNIIEITVQADSAGAAEKQAAAMATSLVSFVKSNGASLGTTYNASIDAQLAPLNSRIASAQQAVNVANENLAAAAKGSSTARVSAASAQLSAAQSLLTTLIDRQQNLQATSALQSVTLTPGAQQLGSPTSASVSEPRPSLYTLIAAIIALALSIQIAVTLAERRRRLRPAGSASPYAA